MKAISIYQPTAAAVALGAKRLETRPWKTSYRGLIAIHAAKRWNIHLAISTSSSWTWCGILHPLGIRMGGKVDVDDVLAFGAVVAVANLVDCRPTDSFTVAELDRPRIWPDAPQAYGAWTERMLGDFTPGRFVFVLDDVRPLETPILVKGRQRIFNLDPATSRDVEDQFPLPTNEQVAAGRRRLPG